MVQAFEMPVDFFFSGEGGTACIRSSTCTATSTSPWGPCPKSSRAIARLLMGVVARDARKEMPTHSEAAAVGLYGDEALELATRFCTGHCTWCQRPCQCLLEKGRSRFEDPEGEASVGHWVMLFV